MTKTYKTKTNLQKTWSNIDEAYEKMEKALEMLTNMTNLPAELQKEIASFDITTISSLKEQVEIFMDEL